MFLINFRNYVEYLKEKTDLSESVLNKITKLFTIKKPELIVQEFRKIFNIEQDIKFSKTEIGGSIDLYTKHILFSDNSSLIHELIHYIQLMHFEPMSKTYYEPSLEDDTKLMKYILQPIELNNWAISLAIESLEYKSFDDFLNIARKTENFKDAKKKERLGHILWLLINNKGKFTDKLLKTSKQYAIIIKSIKLEEYKLFEVRKITDIL